MKRLREKEVATRIEIMQDAATDSRTWNKMYSQFCIPVRLEVPLGELARDDSSAWAGFVIGHRMAGRIEFPLPITGKEGFAAQGLEGKVAFDTTLASVGSVWDELPRFRRALYV